MEKRSKMSKFQFNLQKIIFNIFYLGEKQVKAEVLYFQKQKKKKFYKRLQNLCLKKKFEKFWKMKKIDFFQKKWNIDFREKHHLEVVFSTSSAKKWIFWTILKLFSAENFFHRTNSFFSTSAWKFLFFTNFDI